MAIYNEKKMNIIAHRGFWINQENKNSINSFKRALSNNFGIETDVRDYCGKLVISHDIPTQDSIGFDDFLKIYCEYNKNTTLAINIKSDGLAEMIGESLNRFGIDNYFVFDMSFPDLFVFLNKNITTYARLSEFEQEKQILEGCKGIWLDEFYKNWFDNTLIEHYIDRGFNICIVSPELHGRTYKHVWEKYRLLEFKYKENVSICTDYPDIAKKFFYDN